jgi:hypothetical protein
MTGERDPELDVAQALRRASKMQVIRGVPKRRRRNDAQP